LLVVAVSRSCSPRRPPVINSNGRRPIVIGRPSGASPSARVFVRTRPAERAHLSLKAAARPARACAPRRPSSSARPTSGWRSSCPSSMQVVNGASATRAGFALMPTSIGDHPFVGARRPPDQQERRVPLVPDGRDDHLLRRHVPDSLLSRAAPSGRRGSRRSSWASVRAPPARAHVAVQNSVRYEDVGVASSLTMFCRTMGQVLGPSFATTLWITRFDANVHRLVPPDTVGGPRCRGVAQQQQDHPRPGRADAHTSHRSLRLGINDAFRFAALSQRSGSSRRCS
jgi:hypothetical protein